MTGFRQPIPSAGAPPVAVPASPDSVFSTGLSGFFLRTKSSSFFPRPHLWIRPFRPAAPGNLLIGTWLFLRLAFLCAADMSRLLSSTFFFEWVFLWVDGPSIFSTDSRILFTPGLIFFQGAKRPISVYRGFPLIWHPTLRPVLLFERVFYPPPPPPPPPFLAVCPCSNAVLPGQALPHFSSRVASRSACVPHLRDAARRPGPPTCCSSLRGQVVPFCTSTSRPLSPVIFVFFRADKVCEMSEGDLAF